MTFLRHFISNTIMMVRGCDSYTQDKNINATQSFYLTFTPFNSFVLFIYQHLSRSTGSSGHRAVSPFLYFNVLQFSSIQAVHESELLKENKKSLLTFSIV